MSSKTGSQAIVEAARLAAARHELRFIFHAREQMRARNAKVLDVLHAVNTATRAEQQPN